MSTTTPALHILTPLSVDRPRLQAAVFDFDGTLSTLRHGWEAIMAPMMVEMIAGATTPTPALRQEVDEYIDQSTGIQTIHQMVWLAEAVTRYGLNATVHDPWWYKGEYNRRLLEPVNARLATIAQGEATVEDFSIAGGRAFLQALRARGVILYVASGTDHPDVVREATTLEFADYFQEIAGAPVGTIDCSKEAVLRRLVEEHGLCGAEVLVVGDGRVEIALGRQIGALTLGLATDEARRQGMNPVKATRVTSAGAHALAGDFLALDALLKWLNL
jgi:phosphoglycolate phosphatase-like HAD superfamily hydrolase